MKLSTSILLATLSTISAFSPLAFSSFHKVQQQHGHDNTSTSLAAVIKNWNSIETRSTMEIFGANKEGDDYKFAKKTGVPGDSHRVALLNNGYQIHSFKFAAGFSTKKHMHGEESDGVNMISEGTVKIVTDNGSETFEKGCSSIWLKPFFRVG